ncbi:MAG: (Fe-S)-binding protein [Campylobacterota bacterium]
MSINKFNYNAIADDCVKCGKCKPVCTIFNINQDEATSPRGFIDLLGAYQNDELELDENAKNIFETCFLCTNCVEVCPNDLPTDMVIEQVRSDIAKKFGIAWYKRLFFYLLRHRKTMDLLSSFGWMFQTCALKLDKKKQSGLPRFSLPIVKKDRALPFADMRSFLKKYPENIFANSKNIQENRKNKVAIFIGCMSNYTYTATGDALVKILKKLELDIMIPKKQLCCGAPAYFTGAFDTVDYLIKHNIEYFESWIDEVDAVVIPEATCSAMINQDWEHYLHDQPQWRQRAKRLSSKIFMATKWLENNTELKNLLAKSNKQIDKLVTYHDPCHAKKMQNVWQEPRNLLKQNYKLKEMSDSNRCCGFGGVTMQTEKYHLAKAAGAPKAAMIKETNAQIVSAECSACRMQITNSLYQSNVDVEFKNPIELIAQALD